MDASELLSAYARSLGIRVAGEDSGLPLLSVAFGSNVEGRPQHFHGGATAGLLETAGYAALRTVLVAEGREGTMKPINITVQYLSAGKSRPTFALGRIARLGRRNANITVEAWQDDPARPIASAVMNILIS
jgi:acyl-coenzyme A thioesterase PaaI-like protein